MNEPAASTVSCPDHPVWIALSHYNIGPDGAALTFARRLARENGWSDDQAVRVIEEYKRFCFLAVTAEHPVTPSDAVDQAWHLHLTYSRDYWERFCPEVLGRLLHHGPTAGGIAEQARYFEQYANTLKSYEAAFGETAPANLWPKASQRLLDDPRARRVHPRDGIVIKRCVLWTMAAALAAGLLGYFLRGG
jgi:hypothetical protein